MTARDEAISAMNTAKWGDPRQRMYEDFGRLLDAISPGVLAQLAVERGGLMPVNVIVDITGEYDIEDITPGYVSFARLPDVPLYRMAEQ